METIKEIKAKLQAATELDETYLAQLARDERKGVQTLLASFYRKQEKQKLLHERFNMMKQYETSLKKQGFQYIAGVDEVGRGPLAGPVVAAAVVLPDDFAEIEINDSKQLADDKKLQLYHSIKKQALAIGIGVCSPEIIDQINIYEATKQAMRDAIAQLDVCDYVLFDAMQLEQLEVPQQKIIKGDTKSISIAAASIIAKVERDNMMQEYAKKYPGYDFENNVGYGTAKHLQGLEQYGITPIHRKTFAPIKNML